MSASHWPGSPALFVLLFVLLTAALGCDPNSECIARGGSTTFEGSASYTGQGAIAPRRPVSGALAASVVVYDITAACTYDSMEFTVGIGSCLLWAQLGDAGNDAGTDFYASVEPGQACVLPLADGVHTVNVTTGTLVVAGSSLQLTIAANFVPAPDGGTVADYLQWSFVGQ